MKSSLDVLIGNINLTNFPGVREAMLEGEKGVFIPYEKNPSIKVSQNGIYLNISVMVKSKEQKRFEETHTISAFIPHIDMSKLSLQERKAMIPILGNLRPAICNSADPELTGSPTGGIDIINKKDTDTIPL